MKKTNILLMLGLVALPSFFALAQKPNTRPQPCGTNEVMEQEFQKHPELRQQFQDQQNAVFEVAKNTTSQRAEKKIIPVVFHVVHDCGIENISKAQIEDQIAILNADFSRNSPRFAQTPACHQAVAADCEIEFRLATKDEQGNCTDGVVRVVSNRTYEANNSNGIKEVSRWNMYKYLNIWVVNSIGTVDASGGEILGYAQFPLGGLPSTDGIVVRHDCVGSIGTALTGPFAPRVGSTLTHEIGHWLGLRHIWGDAPCASDGIDDTPSAYQPNYGICWSDFPYSGAPSGEECTEDLECGEMFMNYMDYSDDQCMSMFTQGQKAVMQATLTSARSNISSPENLLATGTRDEDLANPITCAPVPQFCENRRMICEGGTVAFEGSSFNADSPASDWSFEGGTPASSTNANPTVTYASPGLFDVALTASGSAGSNTLTRSDYVVVSSDAAMNANGPFADGFEDAGYFNSNFVIFNNDGTSSKYEHFPQVGFYSGACVRMNNFNNTATELDELITPSYNVSTVPNPVFQFAMAGAERGGEPNDELRVSFSTNCGQTWASPRLFDFADINSAGLYTNEFVPSNPNQWRIYNISLSSFASQQNLRVKFEYKAGNGDRANHVYIDGINIGSSLGIMNFNDEIGMSLYPNPAGDMVQLSFETTKSESVAISVYNMLGKQVLKPMNTRVSPGTQQFNIDLAQLSAGLYTVALDIDGRRAIKKFVKK